MKSKILALSKNEEFKKLLQQKKVSNKYVTIFFGYLNNKNKTSTLLPCTHDDYLDACSDKIPDKWWKATKRL